MANTDITQTGAQSWRDLQKQNNLQQSTGMEVLDMPVLTGKELMYSPESILDKEVKSPIFTTEKDYWGKSKFDEELKFSKKGALTEPQAVVVTTGKLHSEVSFVEQIERTLNLYDV